MKYLIILFILLFSCGPKETSKNYIQLDQCFEAPKILDEFETFLLGTYLFCNDCVRLNDVYTCGETVIAGNCKEDLTLVVYKRYIPERGIYIYVYSRGELLYSLVSSTKNILTCGHVFPCTFTFQTAWCTSP